MTSNPQCKAALNIMGEHFPCQQMDSMAEGSLNHDGWAHSNRDAEAIWQGHEGVVTQYPEDLSTAVYEAIGLGSVAWENPGGAGVFDDSLARQAGATLIAWIDKYYELKKEYKSA